MYYLYILFSENADRFYIGHSADPWNRLNFHLSNTGEKFTGSFKDWKLLAVFKVSKRRSDAFVIEQFIKKQKSRTLIQKLIDPTFIPTGKLAQLVRVPHERS